jgi:hypothetical protein
MRPPLLSAVIPEARFGRIGARNRIGKVTRWAAPRNPRRAMAEIPDFRGDDS